MVEELSQRTGIECTLDDLTYSFFRTDADSIFSPTHTEKKSQYVKEICPVRGVYSEISRKRDY